MPRHTEKGTLHLTHEEVCEAVREWARKRGWGVASLVTFQHHPHPSGTSEHVSAEVELAPNVPQPAAAPAPAPAGDDAGTD